MRLVKRRPAIHRGRWEETARTCKPEVDLDSYVERIRICNKWLFNLCLASRNIVLPSPLPSGHPAVSLRASVQALEDRRSISIVASPAFPKQVHLKLLIVSPSRWISPNVPALQDNKPLSLHPYISYPVVSLSSERPRSLSLAPYIYLKTIEKEAVTFPWRTLYRCWRSSGGCASTLIMFLFTPSCTVHE